MRLRLLAVVALALAAVPISSRVHLEVVGETAVGEVTALEAKTDADGDKTYTPVIETITEAGQRVTLHGLSVSPPLYAVGEHVDVIYDPADPQAGAIGSPLARWWWWALVVAVCLACSFPGRAPAGRLGRYRAARYVWARALGVGVASVVSVALPVDRGLARGGLAVAAICGAVFVLCRIRLARCPGCERSFPNDAPPARAQCPRCACELDACALPVARALTDSSR